MSIQVVSLTKVRGRDITPTTGSIEILLWSLRKQVLNISFVACDV